jgi:excisionase family DNA binding protein
MVSEYITGSMLTVTDVAHMLHAHNNTIRRWADQGIIKSYRINHRGDRRFRREDIMNFLTELNSDDSNFTKNDSAS